MKKRKAGAYTNNINEEEIIRASLPSSTSSLMDHSFWKRRGFIEMKKANLPSTTPTLMDHSSIGNQRGQKNKESKQPHLHKDQRRGCNEDIVIAKSTNKCFMENNRPVEKSHGHCIIKENAFASMKIPVEENDTENYDEEDDDDDDDDDDDEEDDDYDGNDEEEDVDDNDEKDYDDDADNDEEDDDDNDNDEGEYPAAADDNDDDEEEEDDDSVFADPQYQYFLSNLRPDGNFYTLDIVEDNVFVKYHEETSCSEPEAKTLFLNENENHATNAVSNVVNKKKHNPATYEGKRRGGKQKHPKLDTDKSDTGSGSDGLAVGNANHVSNATALVVAAMPAPVKYESKRRGRKSKYPKLFVDNSVISSGSHVFAIGASNHVTNAVATLENKEQHTPAKYEGKRKGRKPKHPKVDAEKSAGGSGSHVLAIDDSNHVANATALVVAEMPAPINCEIKRRGRKSKYPKLYVDKSANNNLSHVASEAHKLPGRHEVVQALPSDKGMYKARKLRGISKRIAIKNTKGNSKNVSSEVHDHAGKRRGKWGKKNAVPLALESARVDPTEGQTVDYEIKEENEDDGYDDDEHHRRRPVHNPVLNANLFLEEDDDEANAKKPTEFRNKLIEELKKPYCQEEYKRLYKEITKRKPAQGQKVLRGHTKSYDKKHGAKSYLDHHIDLARKIDKVRDDHHKVLILLRGFFYWLKNVSHEGKFRPWRVHS